MRRNNNIMIKRKILTLSILLISTILIIGQNQKPEYKNNFEFYEDGTIITEPGVKKRLFTWGKTTTFTAKTTESKGNKGSNGYAVSSENQGVNCVKYFNLENGETYIWKIAVKVEGDVKSSKGKYALKVLSGKGDMSHKYIEQIIDEPEFGKWIEYKNEFTVIEGYEKLNVQVSRWASGTKLCVDDFVVRKKN